jgi:glycosyltransferase involved in cell wall biosynthesis
MHIIIYSGSHNLNNLGATKSIDVMLVKFLLQNGCKVTWAGRGELVNPLCDYHNLGKGKLGEFIQRGLNKLRRVLLNVDVQDILFAEHISFDCIMASKIRSGEIRVDSNAILIGRNVMSLETFKAVKNQGGKTLLHSQWMHPVTQNKVLRDVFEKIEIDKKPIKEDRIKRQLLEIEKVDWIWCISNLVKSSYLSNGVNESKLISLSLGVDNELYGCGDVCDKSVEDEFVILFVGNVNPEKGVHILLEAILNSELKDIKIVFNGHVPDYFESIFYRYVDRLQSRNISIKVCPGAPFENYKSASIFVLPSTHESFGLVVLEAMAAGLPVIVSDMVGAKDCIREGKNGFVFKSGNSSELSNYILKFYENNKLVQEMGQQSSLIAKEYDWSVTVNKIYNSIKNRKNDEG